MGVIHKLKPEIKDYIVKIQAEKPQFGCRKITSLLFDKFQISVSKSSINTVIKNAGFSKPVGRRLKLKRRILEAESSGALLLRAIESLFGQSCLQAAKSATNNPYLIDFKDVRNMEPGPDPDAISTIFQEIRCYKVGLSDGKSFFLDGQFKTVWETSNIPGIFSATAYESNSYINNCFKGKDPFILFTAPGSNIPSKEFFNFLLSLDMKDQFITKVTLYNHKLDEVKNVPIEQKQKHHYVFSLWPWQFSAFRKVHFIGEFKLVYHDKLKKEFYLADIEVELMQLAINKRVTLKGCAVKVSLTGKINMVILSNFKAGESDPGRLFSFYVSCWPNLEEGFQDFSRKIELFTYSPAEHCSFSLQDLELDKEQSAELDQSPSLYLRALDQYLRCNFFPPGYEKKSFANMLEQVYNLKANIKGETEYLNLDLKLSRESPFYKDLSYACRRLNERNIILESGKRLRLNII